MLNTIQVIRQQLDALENQIKNDSGSASSSGHGKSCPFGGVDYKDGTKWQIDNGQEIQDCNCQDGFAVCEKAEAHQGFLAGISSLFSSFLGKAPVKTNSFVTSTNVYQKTEPVQSVQPVQPVQTNGNSFSQSNTERDPSYRNEPFFNQTQENESTFDPSVNEPSMIGKTHFEGQLPSESSGLDNYGPVNNQQHAAGRKRVRFF